MNYFTIVGMSNLPAWIISKLNERDWSQSDLARASGLTRSAISYILKGKSKSPDDETLRRIAKAFQVSPEEVFRISGSLPPKPEADALLDAITQEVAKMSPQEKIKVYETVKLWSNLSKKR